MITVGDEELGDDPYDAMLTLKAQRDEAREQAARERVEADAALKRLGDQAQNIVRRFNEERARANEAAKLSAAARDEADDLRKVIADQREHITIVEGDRTDFDAWTSNVCHEFGLEPLGDGRKDIADLLRRLHRTNEFLLQQQAELVALVESEAKRADGERLRGYERAIEVLRDRHLEYARVAGASDCGCADHLAAVASSLVKGDTDGG